MLTAKWTPVYIEPLPHSGERICAAIAFESEEGGRRIVSTMPPHALEALFGGDAKAMSVLGATLVNSLSAHLSMQQPIAAWEPPFEGVERGRTREVMESNWEQLIDAVVSNMASLAMVKPEPKNKEESALRTWAEAVGRVVIERDQRLRMNFDVPVQFERGSTFKLGFVGNALAAEFAVIQASSPWATQSTTFMRKLAHLVQARKHGGLFTLGHHEILTKIPAVLTAEQTERFGNHKIDAERMADSMEIVFKTYTGPEQAASHILKIESH